MTLRASNPPEDESVLRQLADELFITTDLKDWVAARGLFVDGPIEVDMSSLVGGAPVRMSADELLNGFKVGLHVKKASHHLATNYKIVIDNDTAELYAHGYSWNRVAELGPGADLWETWGNYRLTFRKTTGGWKLNGFRYDSKLTRGNEAVRTHSL